MTSLTLLTACIQSLSKFDLSLFCTPEVDHVTVKCPQWLWPGLYGHLLLFIFSPKAGGSSWEHSRS